MHRQGNDSAQEFSFFFPADCVRRINSSYGANPPKKKIVKAQRWCFRPKLRKSAQIRQTIEVIWTVNHKDDGAETKLRPTECFFMNYIC